MQKRILPIIALSMALITPVIVQGCSSQSETTTTTTSEPQSLPRRRLRPLPPAMNPTVYSARLFMPSER
jgi:hypothetical protein